MRLRLTGAILLMAIMLLFNLDSLQAQQDERYFPQTGFRVDNDIIWSYFADRGGVDTFGYPASQVFTYDGFQVQIFQRHVLQIAGNAARPLNLLDPEVMPINTLNGSTFPSYDAGFASRAPTPGTANYGTRVSQHIAATVPNTWEGHDVGFHDYYMSAAPANSGGLRTLIALEVWGFPTSAPAVDPTNHNFIYQRFQRGIMHHDASTGVTRGILLGDEFKRRQGLAGQGTPTAATPTTSTSPSTAEGAVPVMGVEINAGRAPAVAARAKEAGVAWVRYNGIHWDDVEASQGNRNWGALETAGSDLQAIAAQGLTATVVIHGTPGWAQKVPGSACGPIREDALDDFAAFVREVVSRYSRAPYNVKYWEIGNEPDVDPSLLMENIPFGCWGDLNDDYYGGGYYAAMLKQVYPAIKQADPNARVILGGLLLDCDPTQPPAGRDCKASRFLEGVLRAGGGAYFDILGFHAYALWSPTVGDSELAYPAWSHRGGVLLGKLAFIRETMSRYNVSKPIHMNEGGLLCHETQNACPGDAFYEAQAQYVPRLYARAWANNLQNAVWFTLNGPGWRNGGLLAGNGTPRPSYNAMKFLGSQLGGASYSRTLSTGNLEGYEFRRGNTTYQLYWTNDGSNRTVAAPQGTQGAWNYLGQPVTVSGSVPVGPGPVYIRINR